MEPLQLSAIRRQLLVKEIYSCLNVLHTTIKLHFGASIVLTLGMHWTHGIHNKLPRNMRFNYSVIFISV